MKRTMISLIVAGLFAGVGGSAIGQNVTAGEQPANAQQDKSGATDPKSPTQKTKTPAQTKAAPADPMAATQKPATDPQQAGNAQNAPVAKSQKPGMAAKDSGAKGKDVSADAAAKADYRAARDKAQTDYKDAKSKCDSQQGDAMRSCMTDAKAARTEALAEAKTQWDSAGGAKARDNDTQKGPAMDVKPETRSGNDADQAVLAETNTDSKRSAADVAPVAELPAVASKSGSTIDPGAPITDKAAAAMSDKAGVAKSKAEIDFQLAKTECNSLAGTAKATCMMWADAGRTKALGDAAAQGGSQGEATVKAGTAYDAQDSGVVEKTPAAQDAEKAAAPTGTAR